MTWRILTLACLVLSGACRTKNAVQPQAPETVGVGSAEERGKLEAQAHTDLAASEAKIAELETQELSALKRERLVLLKALVADAHAALAKAFCTAKCRETVAWAREVLGGNGIVADYKAARFFADAEALYSYEGTYQMQNLIIGKAITGLSAFV